MKNQNPLLSLLVLISGFSYGQSEDCNLMINDCKQVIIQAFKNNTTVPNNLSEKLYQMALCDSKASAAFNEWYTNFNKKTKEELEIEVAILQAERKNIENNNTTERQRIYSETSNSMNQIINKSSTQQSQSSKG